MKEKPAKPTVARKAQTRAKHQKQLCEADQTLLECATFELPHPVELAKIAAACLPACSGIEQAAVMQAVRLHREAVNFCRRFEQADKAGKATILGERGVRLQMLSDLNRIAIRVPAPESFPATLDTFLDIIVKVRIPADAMARLRDYFRTKCDGSDPDSYASKRLAGLRKISEEEWYVLAVDYLKWWKQVRSEINRKNREKEEGQRKAL